MQFGEKLKEVGRLASMGSVAECLDNALMESFFATLKCELVHRGLFESREEARTAIFEYIECFYNPIRRHSSLGHVSPIDYERSTLVETTAAYREVVHQTLGQLQRQGRWRAGCKRLVEGV